MKIYYTLLHVLDVGCQTQVLLHLFIFAWKWLQLGLGLLSPHPIHLYLIFVLDFWNIEFETFSKNQVGHTISNLIFTACVACKHLVWNRLKMKFIDFWKSFKPEFSKIKYRWLGCQSIHTITLQFRATSLPFIAKSVLSKPN